MKKGAPFYACGRNDDGQLGLGDNTDRNTFTAVPPLPDGKIPKQVMLGTYHTMILTEDGTVFACGCNGNGQLGLGNNTDRNTLTAVPPLPDGKIPKQVTHGTNHTMILTEDGIPACIPLAALASANWRRTPAWALGGTRGAAFVSSAHSAAGPRKRNWVLRWFSRHPRPSEDSVEINKIKVNFI
jgi:hypothetical protein